MFNIYVWDAHPFTGGSTFGHIAMVIEGGTPPEVQYVSWWPQGSVLHSPAHTNRTYNQEIREEGFLPDWKYTFRSGFNETAMKAAWTQWKRNTSYILGVRSCADCVYTVLTAGIDINRGTITHRLNVWRNIMFPPPVRTPESVRRICEDFLRDPGGTVSNGRHRLSDELINNLFRQGQ